MIFDSFNLRKNKIEIDDLFNAFIAQHKDAMRLCLLRSDPTYPSLILREQMVKGSNGWTKEATKVYDPESKDFIDFEKRNKVLKSLADLDEAVSQSSGKRGPVWDLNDETKRIYVEGAIDALKKVELFNENTMLKPTQDQAWLAPYAYEVPSPPEYEVIQAKRNAEREQVQQDHQKRIHDFLNLSDVILSNLGPKLAHWKPYIEATIDKREVRGFTYKFTDTKAEAMFNLGKGIKAMQRNLEGLTELQANQFMGQIVEVILQSQEKQKGLFKKPKSELASHMEMCLINSPLFVNYVKNLPSAAKKDFTKLMKQSDIMKRLIDHPNSEAGKAFREDKQFKDQLNEFIQPERKGFRKSK